MPSRIPFVASPIAALDQRFDDQPAKTLSFLGTRQPNRPRNASKSLVPKHIVEGDRYFYFSLTWENQPCHGDECGTDHRNLQAPQRNWIAAQMLLETGRPLRQTTKGALSYVSFLR
jgi:hypothetical protein